MSFKKLQIILCLLCVCTQGFAESEEARARRLAREDINYDAIQDEELAKARKLARDDIDYVAVKRQVEADLRSQVRSEIDTTRIAHDEEANLRYTIAASIDRQKIFSEEWNRISQNLMLAQFSPAQVKQYEREIYDREIAGVQERVKQLAENQARKDVYPRVYESYAQLVKDEVRQQFQQVAVYGPIQEQARALEIARITKEEENRVRNEMSEQIRRAFRERCKRGEIVVLESSEKSAIEKAVWNDVREEETKKLQRHCYANTRDTLTEDEKRRIHYETLEKVLGDFAERKERYFTEQRDSYTNKIENWNRMIRLANFFLLPCFRIDEYLLSAEVDRLMYAYEKQMQ